MTYATIGNRQGRLMKKSIQVCVGELGPGLAEKLARRAASCQRRYVFTSGPPKELPCFQVSSRVDGPWVQASRAHCIDMTSRGMAGICHYLRIEEDLYLLAGALAGLVQWRVLELNPLLQEEDLHLTDCGAPCLLGQPRVEDVALLLERGELSWSTREFYRCLGVEEELAALQAVLVMISDIAQRDNETSP